MSESRVSVIVLTLNEEENIEHCLQSVDDWTDDIHVVDSHSDDATVELAGAFTENIHTVDEGHWATIRNWALETLPLQNRWTLFLDADERLTSELKSEIDRNIQHAGFEGFYLKRRFIFLGRWLKHGRMYPNVLRLFNREKAEYIESGDVEYVRVEGPVGHLKNDMIHDDRKPFSEWVRKHDRIADRAADRYLTLQEGDTGKITLQANSGNTIEGGKRHWIREYVWDNIPLFVRPFLLFFYAYVIRLGFLDGAEGLLFHLHHKFWYHLLIYTKVKERTERTKGQSA